jgi:uncharacterized membrane protein YuzA (DUF378 family)
MGNKMSIIRRIIYLIFGISGVVAIWATGFWYGSVVATFFHSTVLIASTNWGLVGITGRDIVEWIEITIKKN